MKTSEKLIVALILCVAFLVPAKAYAWQEDHSAAAVCDAQTVKIQVSFTNQESSGAEKCMNVVAKDQESGNSIDLGNVNPGETKTGTINLNTSTTDGGKIIFELEWCSDSNGRDTREANYSALDCREEEKDNGNNGGGGGEDKKEDKKSERLEVNKKVRIGDDEDYSSKAVGVDQSKTITWLLELKNTGEKNIQDIEVKDTLPSELVLVPGKLEDQVGEVKDGSSKNLFLVTRVKDGINLADKCVTNKVEIQWEDEDDSDEATVCFEDQELTELPKTGFDNSTLAGLGAVSLLMGTSIKVFGSLLHKFDNS